MYCVTIYNENLWKLNGDESLRIMRLIAIEGNIGRGKLCCICLHSLVRDVALLRTVGSL